MMFKLNSIAIHFAYWKIYDGFQIIIQDFTSTFFFILLAKLPSWE